MENYFIHPKLGKIIIINGKYYKNQLNSPLSVSEFREILRIFNNNSKTYLNSINLLSNKNLKYKEYLIPYINWIESIIPENVIKNLYRNIEKLEFEFGIEYVSLRKDENLPSGRYYVNENKILIYKHTIEKITGKPYESLSPSELNSQELNEKILHELLHMASSEYDEENNVKKTGFDNLNNENERNIGLTEGFTELLAFAGSSYMNLSSGYLKEVFFAKQLSLVTSFETMKQSYFGNYETKLLEKELNSIIPNELMAKELFRNIENNYNLEQKVKTKEQTFVGNIQATLIKYFEQKMILLINNNSITKEQLVNFLSQYEVSLIKPEIIRVQLGNPENYIGLNESIEYFRRVKENLLDLSEECTQNRKVS